MPVFQLLAKKCRLKVFYTWGEDGAKTKYDPDFKQIISWDLPLMEGYDYQFLTNHAKDQGSHHFSGIKNRELITSVNNFAPDVILVYGWAYQSHLSALRYFKGKIPIWFRGDSTLLNNYSGLKAFTRNLFLRWVYKHIDTAFYVGSANKAYFEKFSPPKTQLKFAPHAVDNHRFSENRIAEAEVIRKKLNITSTDLLVLFAGKLEGNKNPELLLNSFLDLQKSNVFLLFVGNGVLEDQLKTNLKNRGSHTPNATNVHFIGFQNQTQMPVIYQACDIFCLPSRNETWGLAINEAMAAGKAILVSDKVGCAVDLVRNGENGYIFENNNMKDLKAKLELLLARDLKKMGQTSAQIINEWSFEKQANVFIENLHP